MRSTIKAVIFDMDGVLIDSEHLWRMAMIAGFSEFGMPITEEQCKTTMGMRFGEVIGLWLDHFNKTELPVKAIEDRVHQLLLNLINREGKFIPGIPEIIELCSQKKIKMGLATSSSEILMNAVLKKLNLLTILDVTVSAEKMKYGKPHPEVFLVCAEKLRVSPNQCLVIEDSLNGVIAAKAAQMKVVAVPDDVHTKLQQFALADYKFDRMMEVLDLLPRLLEVGYGTKTEGTNCKAEGSCNAG
jgi:HAD superfamily hydrolase (TIGR01509 family)